MNSEKQEEKVNKIRGGKTRNASTSLSLSFPFSAFHALQDSLKPNALTFTAKANTKDPSFFFFIKNFFNPGMKPHLFMFFHSSDKRLCCVEEKTWDTPSHNNMGLQNVSIIQE